MASFLVTDGQGNPVSGSVEYDSTDNSAVFVPAEGVPMVGPYDLTLTDAIHYAGGQPIGQTSVRRFPVTPPLEVDPQIKHRFMCARATVYFDAAIDPATLTVS